MAEVKPKFEKDASKEISGVSKPQKRTVADPFADTRLDPFPSIWTEFSLIFVSIGFFFEAIVNLLELKKRGKLWPINLKISRELAKITAGVGIISLGIISLIFGGVLTFALVAAGAVLAVELYQLALMIKGGEFEPLNKNKLKISNTIIQVLGLTAVIGCTILAIAIPVFGLIAATVVGLAMITHQLALASHKFGKAKTKLKEFDTGSLGKEFETLQRTHILTPEQTRRFEELKLQHDQLNAQCNTIKIIDVITKGGLVLSGVIILVGVIAAIAFPPAAPLIIGFGIAINIVSVAVKIGAIVVDAVIKKRAHMKESSSLTEESLPRTKEISSPTVMKPDTHRKLVNEVPLTAEKSLLRMKKETSSATIMKTHTHRKLQQQNMLFDKSKEKIDSLNEQQSDLNNLQKGNKA